MRMRTLLNPFSCFQRHPKKSWDQIFPNFQNVLDVEMGCGTGSFMLTYAATHPDRCLVGFEIRKRLVECAQAKIEEQKLTNAHLLWANGQIALEDMFQDESIDRLFIFHPDPWPKLAHRKRRIITPAFLELVSRKLKPNGLMYLATDVPELWDYMFELINESKLFKVTEDNEFWQTVYQTRWKEMSLEQNRSISYATFKKI